MLLIYNNLLIVSKLLLWKLRVPVMPDPRPQESANVPAGGEVAAATESIEPALHTNLKLANPSGMRNNVPGGKGARGSGAT